MKELKGWMRPHELVPRDGRKPFDPVAEGSRYGLSQELSLAIWERVCAEAIDRNGQPDLEQAKQRFHAIAARIATRGGRWPYSDVGKRTRVETERDGSSSRGAGIDELATRVPGRRTLVEAEASRWEPAGAAAIADAPGRRTLVEAEASRWKATATAAIDQVIDATTDETREDIGTTAPSAPERHVAPVSGAHRLPIPTLDRMERAFGRRFDDVEIHVDSGEVPTGIEAFTRGRHIFFGRGAFAPESAHGEHVIAHELAHVAQQSATAGGALPTRAALEADAHQAARSALAGRAARVSLFAPPAAALGFSDGNAQHAPSSGGSGGSSRSTPGAPGRTSGGSARAPASGGSAIPRPKPAPSAKAPTRPASAPAGSVPVSAPPRRGPTGDGLRISEAPSALTPAAAGRLHTVQADNQGNAAATTTLPTGQQQTDVGRAAVEEPQAEQDARAQHGVVTDVDNRPPPSPEIEQACARIRQVIRDKRPPDEDKLVEAKPREMAQEAGNQMSADVEQRAGTVRQGYADMQQPPPGSPSSAPVPPTLPPQRAETQPVDAGAAAPDPVNPDDVSLDGDVADQNKQIEDAGMNTEPGKLVQDGPIGDARGGADELSELARTDPAKVIADQAKVIATAKGDMRALQQAADKALADARAGTVDQMGKHTTGVKGSEEQQRAQAGEKMKGIFDRAQKAVDGLLQPLAGKAVARWEAGVALLSTEFEGSLADVKRRIDERHSGFTGALTGAWDWATGLPDWVTDGYDRAEAKFADGATNLIRDISRDVNAVIEDCKGLIQQARKDIDAVVKSLPASLQAWAQGEAAKLNQQLDALDKRVDQAQKGVNKDLINRANSAVQEVREKVHELREAAKGAIGKIADALVEFAKNPAKAIVNGLLHVLGIPPASFWSLLDRLGDVVGAIAKDPVKFGKTLISGAGQGFKQFFEHFPTHLKEILMGWLFGTMGTAGVQMPSDFSGPSIMVTVLGIIGIDTGTISSMIGADVNDPAEMAELKQELGAALSGDPHAIVALLRDHFDPASLIPMIREAAMSFLIQALILQVAPRIAAMLVPGGAILQAVEAIFKVLMWVVTNAARIFTLIESLVATAGQAVAGNIAGVAAGVESSLAQIIVLVIDFLASYIGLGGLGTKLKGVIMKVSGKLKGILKKVLDAIKKRAKAKAKTKHDHDKPPHDHAKPDDHKPSTHKPDDRDPQKAKDDAKDPRNHQRDPDDAKDPRNHGDDHPDKRKDRDDDPDRKLPRRPHDDDDPNAPRRPHDDDDPKRRKDDDDRDPDKKREHDAADARSAARAAANRGWSAARAASEREVQSKTALEALLARAEHSTPKTKISLEVGDRGTTWTVEATARVDAARAHDTEGSGWIARGDGGKPWYAARDLGAFNRKLIEDGFHELKQAPGDQGPGDSHGERAPYDHKVRQGKQLVERMQQRLDGEIRGLKVGIEMEPWSGVERDHLIATELSVKPNTTQERENVPVEGEFEAVTRTATWSSGEQVVVVGVADGEPSISDANHTPIVDVLSEAAEGPFRNARNTAGARVLNQTIHRMAELGQRLQSVKSMKGQEAQNHAEAVASDAVKIVSSIGASLHIPNLARAKLSEPIPQMVEPAVFKIPLWLDPVNIPKFEAEVRRQGDEQEKGTNALTLDEWIANLDAFKIKDEAWLKDLTEDARLAALSELRRRVTDISKRLTQKRKRAQKKLDDVVDQIAATGYTHDEALRALRSDEEIEKTYMGRYGDEAQFRKVHRKGVEALRELEEWDGLTDQAGRLEVILHNPDQGGGGYGSVLDKFSAAEVKKPPSEGGDPTEWAEYLKKLKAHVGVAAVNGQYGSFWKDHAKPIYDKIAAEYTEESYPIWKMHIKFEITYIQDDGTGQP